MDWNGVLQHCASKASRLLGKGAVASYIPALAKADPNAFAMAVIDLDGEAAAIGAADQRFSIQSISKVFSLSMALAKRRADLWRNVGREPSGNAFNSIVQLERENGVPRNPLINAGALIITDTILSDHQGSDAAALVLAHMKNAACSDGAFIDQNIAASEEAWGDRNRALAYFMKGFDRIENDPKDVLSAYFQQCAIAMNVSELARAGLYLANGGVDPINGASFLTRAQANRVNALMLTCGHYDMSGDFAFRVGLPGKSGVGGGILVVAPGVGAAAVWSPGLNEAGNSLAGTAALEAFSDCTGLNIFSDKAPDNSDFDA